MDMLRKGQKHSFPGSLEGQFLLAMPGMRDERFHRSVIYMCAHSDEGAMGFIINQVQPLGFTDILVQLGIVSEQDSIDLSPATRDIIVRNGGPVDRSRGFVLHTRDYFVESSHAVAPDIGITATVDILRAISRGRGPRNSLLALGYSGWGAGQLESEIAANGWLSFPVADTGLLFDTDVDHKYERIMASMGIDPARLSGVAGHA
jgi:putative transcriptional regulator